MATNRRKNLSFSTMVKIFLRDYNIPTKKDVDRITTRLDRLETLIRAMNPPGRSAAGERPRKASPANASEIVTEVVRENPDGIEFRNIQTITGFEEKKLRNIVYRLHRMGKISRIQRGVYGMP